MVDAYSKFINIDIMKTTVASAVIGELQKKFALFGLPTKIVSDNGPPFNSNVFQKYCDTNGIFFDNSPAWHSQSNGLAERCVQTAKKALIRFHLGKENDLSLQAKLEKYLMLSRHSPSFETGHSPAEIVFAYKPKLKLEKIIPKKNNDNNVNLKSFSVGDNVYYRNHFKTWIKWIPAVVKKQVSPLTYLIEINGTVRFVQQNQIRYPSAQDKHAKISVGRSNDSDTESPPIVHCRNKKRVRRYGNNIYDH